MTVEVNWLSVRSVSLCPPYAQLGQELLASDLLSFVDKSHSEYGSGRVGSRTHSSLNVDKVRIKINPCYVYEQLFKPGHILFSNLMMI